MTFMGSRRVAPKRQITFDRLEDRQLLALTMSGTSISATQQQPFSGQVATVYDTNLDDSPASFNSVEINWGDGQTTAGQVVGPLTIPGVFEVIGTHTYTAAGAYSALISVSTASGANATATAKAEVAAPPFLVAVNAIATAPYTPLTDLTVATFIAPNSTATLPTDFSALINWGDGQTTIGTITGGPAAYSVTGSHTYTATGNYTTSVTVAPTNGPTSTASGQADIAYPDVYTTTSNLIVIPSNQPFTGTLATFTGTAGQSQFTGSISWGDGGTSPATVVPDPSMSGTFDINGTYTYTTPGTYPITITLADQAGNTFTAAATAPSATSRAVSTIRRMAAAI
jgi:hypothetical protein